MSKVKQIDIEELEGVTGGLRGKKEGRNSTCSFFLKAFNKSNSGKCDDCYYYNLKNGKKTCTHPSKDKEGESGLL